MQEGVVVILGLPYYLALGGLAHKWKCRSKEGSSSA